MAPGNIVIVVVLAMVITVVAGSETQTFEKVEADTNRAGESAFDYDELTPGGPTEWDKISPDYEVCAKGHHQSPINLLTSIARKDGFKPEIEMYESVVQYAPSGNNFVLSCNGSVARRWCSTTTYYGERYHMLQAHFHSPSEHHIDGKTFPLELHLVHQLEGGKGLLVLGILFGLGKPNPDVQALLDVARQRNRGLVDFPHFIQPGAGLCTYEGSLTTPPCTEGVHWLISTSHPMVSLKQVGEYREMVGEKVNNRPVQPVSNPTARCFVDPEFTGGVAKNAINHVNDSTPILPTQTDASGNEQSGSRSSPSDGSELAEPGEPIAPIESSGSCFPASATVTLPGGVQVAVSKLRIGDEVSVGNGQYSRVFAFSHRDANIVSNHVRLSLESGRTLFLTSGHYLLVNGRHVSAGEIVVGDQLLGEDGNTETVNNISSVRASGLYNPHTLAGSIVVDGILCSTYTTAVDVSAARALLSPLRALFRLGAVTDTTAGSFLARGARSTIF